MEKITNSNCSDVDPTSQEYVPSYAVTREEAASSRVYSFEFSKEDIDKICELASHGIEGMKAAAEYKDKLIREGKAKPSYWFP